MIRRYNSRTELNHFNGSAMLCLNSSIPSPLHSTGPGILFHGRVSWLVGPLVAVRYDREMDSNEYRAPRSGKCRSADLVFFN